jgi:hypothetical protein
MVTGARVRFYRRKSDTSFDQNIPQASRGDCPIGESGKPIMGRTHQVDEVLEYPFSRNHSTARVSAPAAVPGA